MAAIGKSVIGGTAPRETACVLRIVNPSAARGCRTCSPCESESACTCRKDRSRQALL